MESILVFVHYNGEWSQDMAYVKFDVTGIIITRECDFNNLLSILSQQLKINKKDTTLEIKYQVKTGYPPLKIEDDATLLFYKELKRTEPDCTKYPLCVTSWQNQRESNLAETSFGLTNKDVEINEEAPSTSTVPAEVRSTNRQPADNISDIIVYGRSVGKTIAEEGEDINEVAPSTSRVPTEVRSTNRQPADNISDIIVYGRLVGKTIAEEGEEVQSKVQELNIISNTRHPVIKEGQIYKDKETLKTALSFYALNNNFQYKVNKSCEKQYFVNCLDDNCNWELRASKNGKTRMFVIRKLNNNHSCPPELRLSNQRQATTTIIGDFIKTKYLNAKTVYRPADIVRDMKDDFGISVNYVKAWRSKERALEKIRGKPDEAYGKLPSYLHMVKSTNPGSIVDLQTRDDFTFLYAFMALDASIKGWRYCIPVIVVDRTFLKYAYGGTLLSASTQDANGKIFPLAFCIVDSENEASWEWFFRKVREAFGVRNGMSIVSDTHESIRTAIQKVYPEVNHAVCIFHLYNNLKSNFKKSTKEVRESFFAAARAYTIENFEYHMSELEKVDKRLKQYLENVGYQKWARAHSSNSKHTIMTTNVAESLNSKNKGARDLPVTTLFGYLHALIQEWSYLNRKMANSTFTRLAKRAEDILSENNIESLKMKVINSTDELFTVYEHEKTFIVDLKEKTCMCKRFQIDEIPCPHAMAILKEMHQDPYGFCSEYFTKETLLKTYEAVVYPVDNQNMCNVPTEVKEAIVLPPQGRSKTGRPRKRRIRE